MIARIWHGVTPAAKADEYVQFLNRTGVRDYRATEGNLSVHVLRRIEGDESHFLIMTLWESEEAIKKFAGEAVEQARYYPEDREFLLEFEEKVTHYQVVASAP